MCNMRSGLCSSRTLEASHREKSSGCGPRAIAHHLSRTKSFVRHSKSNSSPRHSNNVTPCAIDYANVSHVRLSSLKHGQVIIHPGSTQLNYSEELNTGTTRILNSFGFWMVETRSNAEWFGFPTPSQIRTKCLVFECYRIDHSIH